MLGWNTFVNTQSTVSRENQGHSVSWVSVLPESYCGVHLCNLDLVLSSVTHNAYSLSCSQCHLCPWCFTEQQLQYSITSQSSSICCRLWSLQTALMVCTVLFFDHSQTRRLLVFFLEKALLPWSSWFTSPNQTAPTSLILTQKLPKGKSLV